MTIVEKLGEWEIGVEEDVETFVTKLRQLGQKIENVMEAKIAASIAIRNIMNELGGKTSWSIVEESGNKYHAKAGKYGFEFVVEVIEIGA